MNLIIMLFFLSILQICANNQTEVRIVYSGTRLQNTFSERSIHHERISERLGLDYHTEMRDKLNNDFDLASDYVFLKMPDGKIEIKFKDCIPGYKAYFDMSMLNTTSVDSWYDHIFNSGYENNTGYFANKFDRYSPTRVFHCVGNYRYKGFRDYVKKLPGFEDFILNVGKQLEPGSALHKELVKSGNLQDFAALKIMRQEKVRELEQKEQAKHQADVRQNLRAKNFSNHGMKLLERHGVSDEFLYQKNFEQGQQFEQIVMMNPINRTTS